MQYKIPEDDIIDLLNAITIVPESRLERLTNSHILDVPPLSEARGIVYRRCIGLYILLTLVSIALFSLYIAYVSVLYYDGELPDKSSSLILVSLMILKMLHVFCWSSGLLE